MKTTRIAEQMMPSQDSLAILIHWFAGLALLVFLWDAAAKEAGAIAFSTSGSGVWDSDVGAGGVWSPDGGTHFFPISGDTAQFGNHNITVSTPEVFSGGGNSVGQNPFMTLNSTLTMDAGAFTFTPPSLSVVNGNNGVWDNDGVFNHSTGQTLYWRGAGGGSLTFQNDNELNFTVANANTTDSWRMDTGDASIDNNGLMRATAFTEIFGNTATRLINNSSTGTIRADGAEFAIKASLQDSGGTIEAINGGTLRFNSTATGGGNTTVAGTTFNAAAVGDTVRLGGRINSLEGTITGNGIVAFMEPVVANQALTYIDFGATEVSLVGLSGGTQWTGWPAGNVMEARSPLRHDGSGGYNLINIDGTFRNVAGNKITLDNGNLWYMRGVGAGMTFDNQGTIDFVGGTEIRMDNIGTGTTIDNASGGLIVASSGGTGGIISSANTNSVVSNAGTIRADNATLQFQAALNDTGGTVEAINGGTIRFNSALAGTGHTTVAGTTFSAPLAGDTIRLGGKISSLEGTISGAGTIAFMEPIRVSQPLAYIDFGATEVDLVGLSGATQWTGWTAGSVLEARSPLRHDGSGGYNLMNIDGTFRNVADNTITVDNGNLWYVRGAGGGVTFDNQGILDIVSAATFQMDSGTGSTLLNTGTLSATSAPGAIINGNSATRLFDNQGVVLVDATAGNSTLSINGTDTAVQFNGVDTLTGGEWRVMSGTNTATLNLNSAPNGSITTLASGAKVVLGGANPVFPELSSASLTVGGTFGVHDSQVYGLTTDLNMLAGGRLEFGLGLSDEGGLLSTGLDIGGNVDFTLALLDVVDLGDMGAGTYRLIEWDGTRTGFLALGSTPDNGFDYSLVTMDTTSGYVELLVSAPVPEPSTFVLAALGLVGLRRTRRRRR